MLAANNTVTAGALVLYVLFVIAVYAGFAYGSAKLMQLSGHSPILGVLLGLFCGAIGLLIALAFFLSDPNRRRNTPRQSQQIYPPDPYGYGYQQPYQEPYPPAAPPQYRGVVPPAAPAGGFATSVRCHQCSAPVYPGSEFCDDCGAYVRDQQPALPPQPATQSFKICPLCHGKATADSETCPQCGSSLKDTPAW
jgi:RNA polymerase subunit RPABC4/transcription elongation factor Spt4